MPELRLICVILAAAAGLSCTDVSQPVEETVPVGVEPPLQGESLVQAHCAGCHSLKLVTSNRGDRERWKETIRWMQATQGLWQLEPAIETAIVDYLAQTYPPVASNRRPPLNRDLLPTPAATKN